MTRWSCGSKERHETVPEAMAALDTAKRTWRYPPVRWYRCDGPDGCGGYHLTAKPKLEEVGSRERARMISEEKKARDRRRMSPLAAALDEADQRRSA